MVRPQPRRRLLPQSQLRSPPRTWLIDAAYPSNLRVIYNRPPFLFIRGELRPEDSQAIAVVGTRAASEEGLAQARRLAAGLAEADVTILSGLAKGIDAAAYRAALHDGRTVAVMGTGILQTRSSGTARSSPSSGRPRPPLGRRSRFGMSSCPGWL